MAVQSMTGFGKGESSTEDFSFLVEIKTVNHRFKDIRFKMSSLFNSIELDLKKNINEKFKRGSFDVFVNYRKGETKSKFDDIDEKKVSEYLKFMAEVAKKQNVELSIKPTEFLRTEFYKDQEFGLSKQNLDSVREAFNNALGDLTTSRFAEGNKLLEVIKDHINLYKKNFLVIKNNSKDFQKHVEENLKKKFQEINSELKIDDQRFLQEVVYYLEKMDVHEEMNRIDVHLEKLEGLLETDSEIGRQIDFLVQELNRETNTIGSKSSMQDISQAVVQMKVQLEKIREQGLNLE